MAKAACDSGMTLWGITPHSPIPVKSGANMAEESVMAYLREANDTADMYAPAMNVLTGMEIDYLGSDFGAHIDYFQRLDLDYTIGSVHFVPNQDSIYLDCDGSETRFKEYLRDGYSGDLRYVVEKYFEQVITMIERGGFEILGHFDKIAGNATAVEPELESHGWYISLIDDVISYAAGAKVILEINTKALHDRKRFYPNQRWWSKIMNAGLPIVVNSDAHWPEKVNLGRPEALKMLRHL